MSIPIPGTRLLLRALSACFRPAAPQHNFGSVATLSPRSSAPLPPPRSQLKRPPVTRLLPLPSCIPSSFSLLFHPQRRHLSISPPPLTQGLASVVKLDLFSKLSPEEVEQVPLAHTHASRPHPATRAPSSFIRLRRCGARSMPQSPTRWPRRRTRATGRCGSRCCCPVCFAAVVRLWRCVPFHAVLSFYFAGHQATSV
jgi:hypothetical protein